MGDEQKTIRNLEIMDIRPEYGVIMVRGAVPGSTNSIVLLKKN
jgi:large subunit ribosomal protein L3